MLEFVARRRDLQQFFLVPLGNDAVAGDTIARGDLFLRRGGDVLPSVATEAPRPFFVTGVFWIPAPVGFHLWKETLAIDGLHLLHQLFNTGTTGIFLAQI